MNKHIFINVLVKGILPVALCLGVAGCSQSPMDALKSDTYSEKYSGGSFWDTQSKENTQLWKEAVNYCNKNLQKVNCQPVRARNMINLDLKKYPKIEQWN